HPEPGSNSSLYILIILSLTPTLQFPKKLTLSIFLVSRYLLVLILSVFSMILFSRSEKRVAKVETFFYNANFISTFLQIIRGSRPDKSVKNPAVSQAGLQR
ncbi:MAG: hypothetical protein J6X77_05185, partial [Bacteroidales bacterium]|nr:hypothetical protein [Bacteroidales bacterium]